MLKGKETIDKLINGAVIYIAESNKFERRLYRYNNINKSIEYSDNGAEWQSSNMQLNDFEKEIWIIESE